MGDSTHKKSHFSSQLPETEMSDGDNNDSYNHHQTLSSEEEDEDSLMRMTNQARDRRTSNFVLDDNDEMVQEVENDHDDDHEGDENDEGDEGDEDDDYGEEGNEFDEFEDEVNPSDILGRLIQARSRRGGGVGDGVGDEEDDDEEEDDDDDDDDNEEEDDNNTAHDPRTEFLRAMGSFSNGNQGENSRDQAFSSVLQRLMGGGILFGNFQQDNSEMDGLINNLNQRDDSYIILETLNELSERLLMMNGITAERTIPSSRLSKAFVDIMSDPLLADQLELQLVACRCLYNFLEVNQDFIHDVINNNSIEILCGKLNEIIFIDLTEQALQTLEMISRDPMSHNQIIRHNGLKACLQYLDFLTIHSQRKCLTIVANSCNNISPNNFDMINDVFENIAGVVKSHSDANVIEHGWLSISRTIISFKSHPDLLEKLFISRPDILRELVSTCVISANRAQNSSNESKVAVSFSTCLNLIKSLIILCGASVEISGILLQDIAIGENIIKAINKYSKGNSSAENARDIEMITSKTSNDNVSIEAIMAAPNELISQLLTLIGYLLPISYSSQETPFLKNSHEDYDERLSMNSKREELCRYVMPDAYWKFVNEIWSFLINSFQATMDYEVRRKILIDLFRIVKFCNDRDDFGKIRGVEILSGLLASIVNQGKSFVLKDSKGTDSLSLSQNDTDMASSEDDDEFDDVNEEEDEDDDDDNMVMSQISNKKPSLDTGTDSVSKLNSNVLLWTSFLIVLNSIRKLPQLFVEDFEKEGLINDITLVLDKLKAMDIDKSTESEDYEKSRPFASYYNNKYLDVEFTKEYEYKLSSIKIYNKLVHIAYSINDLYIASKDSDSSADTSSTIKLLDEVKATLSDHSVLVQMTTQDWELLWQRFKQAIKGPNPKSSVSSFELISSGIIELLTKIFTSEDFGSANGPCYGTFIKEFFKKDDTADSPVGFLVNKLQEALTRCESFEIVSAGGSNSSGSRFISSIYHDNSYTAGMARQVKLKLTFDSATCKSLKLPSSMQNMILSVHAIATFKSIETFLKQRIDFIERLSGGFSRSDDDEAIEDLDDDEDNERDVEPNEGESEIDSSTKTSSRRNSEKVTRELNTESSSMEFKINGYFVPKDTTIYGGIYRSLQGDTDDAIDSSKIWNNIHQVSFGKSDEPRPEQSQSLYNSNTSIEQLLSYDTTTINVLKLLKVLFEMNIQLPKKNSLPESKYMNWKLAVKLNRQLEEPLIVASGTLPGWSIHLTRLFPFIFPLDTRIFFLQSTSFGYSRLIHQWQIRTDQENHDNHNNNSNVQRPQLGRPSRNKVRIPRKMILQSAIKVLNLYGSSPGVLEIEYFDEVGSGLGPTLEFYSTVSKEFSKKKLRLWRDDDTTDRNSEAFVVNKNGLFPAPLDKKQLQSDFGKKVVFFFSLLGKFVARSLLDSRIIDFNFNSFFLHLVQIFNKHSMNQAEGVKDLNNLATLSTLSKVDPDLADSMKHLTRYLEAYKTVDVDERPNVQIDGCTIDDLALLFTLPGYPRYELIPGGEDISISAENLESYINKLMEATLYGGIIAQTKAFMDGFSKVFPVSSLIVFSPDELVNLLGNAEEDWSYEALSSAINANHGYTKDSDAIKTLINILIHFNDIEKRSFLQFLTGAPRLPIGGFKDLRPELTVVKKQAEGSLTDDDYLPSVMTCANYLKLPNYSTEEVMKRKILQAISEGADAFLLS